MRELRMVPTSTFSWDFRVFEGEREVALLDRAWIREKGGFTLEGEPYRIEREGLAGRWVLLDGSRRTLASAQKPSTLRRRFEVTAAGRRYILRPAGLFTRRYEVLHQGRVVGEIRPEKPLRRRARVTLPDEVDTASAVLFAFLVTVIWKREAAAHSG